MANSPKSKGRILLDACDSGVKCTAAGRRCARAIIELAEAVVSGHSASGAGGFFRVAGI
jgi:hypothetical protein